MRKRGVFIAVGLLLAVNVIVLAGVGYNRSGEPDAVITMTEREMPVAYSYQKENSGISLSIRTYNGSYGGFTATAVPFDWLDREKLESLGFDFSTSRDAHGQYGGYDKQLPRRTYAVLEFDGPAWTAWKSKLTDELAKVDQGEREGIKSLKNRDNARKNIMRALKTDSHLFIIDVGNDPAALRRQYPDRHHYLILPAKVHVAYMHYPVDKKDDVRGYVELLTSEIYVPHRFHAELRRAKKPESRYGAMLSMSDTEPSYKVVLHIGRRYEPWIADVKMIRQRKPQH